jgi:hypothetical protein
MKNRGFTITTYLLWTDMFVPKHGHLGKQTPCAVYSRLFWWINWSEMHTSILAVCSLENRAWQAELLTHSHGWKINLYHRYSLDLWILWLTFPRWSYCTCQGVKNISGSQEVYKSARALTRMAGRYTKWEVKMKIWRQMTKRDEFALLYTFINHFLLHALQNLVKSGHGVYRNNKSGKSFH